MSEPRLVAGTRAELPGAGAAVLAAGVCQAPRPPRDRLRIPPAAARRGCWKGDEGEDTTREVGVERIKKKKTEADPTKKAPRGGRQA